MHIEVACRAREIEECAQSRVVQPPWVGLEEGIEGLGVGYAFCGERVGVGGGEWDESDRVDVRGNGLGDVHVCGSEDSLYHWTATYLSMLSLCESPWL